LVFIRPLVDLHSQSAEQGKTAKNRGKTHTKIRVE
jgi:hypothetical protein